MTLWSGIWYNYVIPIVLTLIPQTRWEMIKLTVYLVEIIKQNQYVRYHYKVINCIADVLESVVLLGSEGGQALPLFNSSLVCHLVLDQEFGCIALMGCHVLQLSLHGYQDDQLPGSPGPLAHCVYVCPLLFALTASGIVCILFNH